MRAAWSGRTIGLRIGKVLGRHKMAKHVWTADTTATITRNQALIDAETALDGIYVIRTSVAADELPTAAVIQAYKNLANVEKDFKSLKAIDIDIRYVRHYTPGPRARVSMFPGRARTWHLRKTFAELTYTDQNQPARTDPAHPQPEARRKQKATRHAAPPGTTPARLPRPVDHLATLTRNHVRYGP